MEKLSELKNLFEKLKNRRRLWKLAAAFAAVYAAQKAIERYGYWRKVRLQRAKQIAVGNGGAHNNGNGTGGKLSIGDKGIRRRFPALDTRFLNELKQLLKIMVPGVFSKESGFLLVHSSILFIRTFLTIYVADLEGNMTRSIVRVDLSDFAWNLTKFLLLAIPATFINSMIRYFESCLGLAFRSRLIDYSYKKYFSNDTYYRVAMLDGRLSNADQCLTEDITMFANSIAHLYSHLTKPLLDIAVISWTLYRKAVGRVSNMGVAPTIGIGTIILTARVLKTISPKFGKLVAEEARRKGYLRFVHSRLITNAEEIAFYGGHAVEHNQLKTAYGSLRNQMSHIFRQRIFYVMMEQFLMKYVWTGAGMVMIAVPILTSSKHQQPNGEGNATDGAGNDSGYSDRAGGITTGKNLLSSAADAIERLMSSYKEITELAGYTSRVAQMLRVFDEVAKCRYKRSGVPASSNSKWNTRWDISRIDGCIMESPDVISLDDVPIVTPTGDVVVKSLSLQIQPGMHLLITGPNGCGKSSLFRVLGGLWPVYRGTLRKPPPSNLFYIPQRPYLSLGTLRDQVIYPDSLENMREKGHSDKDLDEILNIVHLSYIVERDGGWNSSKDWMDVLSGGEKQRIGLARIFYHKPKFAILDECTSAVSIDVEGAIYSRAKSEGITLLTVSHRPSLWKYHSHILQFDGQGGWTFYPLDGAIEQRLSLAEEKQRIESQLEALPGLRTRLRDVCTVLGDSSVHLDDS